MKTKNLMKGVMIVALATFVMTGCKKEKENPNVDPPTDPAIEQANQSTTSSDQTRVDQEVTFSMDDINNVLNNSPKTRGVALPCNVDWDTTALNKGLIKLTYNGLSCDLLRKREGVISIQLPYDGTTVTPWSTKGAKIIITYDKYKVTRVADGKFIMFDGATNVTNVNGGGVAALLTGTTIIHKSRGALVITFDDGTKCSWGLAASRSYTYALPLLSTIETGDTTINGNANTSFWGVTRKGQNFSVSVTTPVITNLWGSLCVLVGPFQGVRIIRGITREITITYGVDVKGAPIVKGTCPFGYKLNYIDANNAPKEVILPYL
ncbi:MAG: hypothetical protein ABI315_13540 [Bacteroidia bacterium]